MIGASLLFGLAARATAPLEVAVELRRPQRDDRIGRVRQSERIGAF
jgi:hypothetical protein